MNLLIRQARIVDADSDYNNQVMDILVEDGKLSKIGINLKNPGKLEEVKFDNLHVSEGWFDSSVSLGEPGYEDRETIANGLVVAAKSGFTGIALQPNSSPVIDNQSQIAFVKSKSDNCLTNLYPIGALTVQSKGNDLAEMFDMKNSGAVAFGDYNENMDNANLMKIALQYARDLDALVIAYSQDSSLKGSGIANEGVIATQLGMKGIPNLAEELMIARNLYLLEYTGGKLHIPTVSTSKSVQLIKDAKAKGLTVSCSAAVHHLILTDKRLEGFDTRFRVTPPLRTEADRKALLKGVKDGTIDMITSDHNPIDIEHKKMEFDLAKNGTIGLESAYAALQTVLPTELIIQKLTAGKKFFGIPNSSLTEGNPANLTLFNPQGDWIFAKENILSKSKNAVFLGTAMRGKIYGTFNNGKLMLT